MKSECFAGEWHQIKGAIKKHWGRLTGNDLKQIEGHAEQLMGKLQKRYGLPHEEAERQGKEFRRRLNSQ